MSSASLLLEVLVFVGGSFFCAKVLVTDSGQT